MIGTEAPASGRGCLYEFGRRAVAAMAGYNLQPNEALILKEEGVSYGGGLCTHELILTSLNLVIVKGGMFGLSKGVNAFPLTDIKVYQGHAQALAGEYRGRPALDVYFLNGHETFQFRSGGRKKVLTWTAKIDQAVTGQAPTMEQNAGVASAGAAVVKDVLGVFKARLGARPDAPTPVAAKCNACGAPTSGHRGAVVTCEYCGMTFQL